MIKRANQPSLAPQMQSAGVSQDGRIAGRFFLVGCARSGTTLLQVMLARHSRIFSLPETYFFLKAPAGGRWRRLGMVSPAARNALRQTLLDMLKAVGREDLCAKVPRRSPFWRSYAGAFCGILDRLALEHGKDAWVEKTPRHIIRLDMIESLLPTARFIHIVRDGRDVVASIHEVASDYPEIWGRRTVDACIDRWNRDIQITLSKLNTAGHPVVVYEDLLRDTPACLRKLCSSLGLEFEPEMLHHQEAAAEVVGWLAKYPWMRKPFEPLEDTRLRKFTRIFTEEEQRRITGRLLYGGDIGHALNGSPTHAGTALCRNVQ